MRKVSEISFVRFFAVLAFVLLLGGCQSATPATRIASNPVLFQSLSTAQQSLVSKGEICEGMTPEAVFLAWGYPNSAPYEGQKNGKKITRWVYNYMEPVFVNDDWRGPYWGPYGRYEPYYMGPSTVYIPRNAATVLFENGKVVSWESRTSQP